MIKRMKHTVVHSTRDILGGQPVFCGTRVPLKALIDYLKAGDCLDDFLEDFPSVSKSQVVELLENIQGATIKK